VEVLAGPSVETRGDVATIGIRTIVPFRGMLASRDRLLTELVTWLAERDINAVGHFFLRLHVIDMTGPMDIEVGATEIVDQGDDRVRPGSLPAGQYVTLAYRDHSLRANRALLDWAQTHGHALDRTTVPAGDEFGCRTETYLTDPRSEPRKTRWAVELAMRLADQQ
jgi:effector-binding domain-containing protein